MKVVGTQAITVLDLQFPLRSRRNCACGEPTKRRDATIVRWDLSSRLQGTLLPGNQQQLANQADPRIVEVQR